MEGPKFPFAITNFLRLNIPDMIALRLGLLPILVETQDVRLVPKIIANLKESGRGVYDAVSEPAEDRDDIDAPFSSEACPLCSLAEPTRLDW